MKKIKLLLVVLTFAVTTPTFAQDNQTKAIIEFEDAEISFQNKNYSKAITHLQTAKTLLGTTYEKIEYLEILSLYEVFKSKQEYTFEELDYLRSLTQHYGKNYSQVELEKYKDVYAIENALKKYPETIYEFNKIQLEKEEKIRLEKEKIRLEKERIAREEEIKKQEIEKLKEKEAIEREKQRKIDRFSFAGLGYFGSKNSTFGASMMIANPGLGWGIDFRLRPIMTFIGDIQEVSPINYQESRIGSSAVMFTLTHGITYPIYFFLGAGYGTRATYYKVGDNILNENEYKVYQHKGVEMHGGLFIKTGNFGALRLGYSVNKFDFGTKEFIFGYIINFN